ncbi:hypothetical protein D7B24_004775 [Verticillium nonalfalfae]|uniref:Uncharacterized protein n=1 Tax=Verticillium nonalfalfae TaxID=1051616 RepID=A0A3M9YCQ3_9PEZI|nr:uncharacterized protein D7B24_004775 [Verticillium nonalfalfae]RNJ58323.1 hypothetical protein D7B24_004775 [Verticillium nonalfalfae]
MPEGGIRQACGWGTFIALSPLFAGAFFLHMAVAIKAGRYTYRVAVPNTQSRVRLMVRDADQLRAADFVHFKIEHPASRLHPRGFAAELDAGEAHVYTDWKYDVNAGELFTNGATGRLLGYTWEDGHDDEADVVGEDGHGDRGDRFAADRNATEDGPGAIVTRQNRAWTMIVSAVPAPNTWTTASQGCVEKTLKYFALRTAKRHTSSCQPLHNRGDWRYHIGIHINMGDNTKDGLIKCPC